MTSYATHVPQTTKPMRTLTLPPTAFSSKWKHAPRTDVVVGLTLVSLADVETAKSSASMEAWRMFPRSDDAVQRSDAFNDLLVRWLIARGTCDPRDVSKPVPLWKEAPEDIVREALSFDGVKFVWDALAELWVESSPVNKEIDEDEMVELLAIYDSAIAAMPETCATRIRRMLYGCLVDLRKYNPDEE